MICVLKGGPVKGVLKGGPVIGDDLCVERWPSDR